MTLAVFLNAFLLLFLGMFRSCNVYDEGLILTGAMRVAAGAVPYRDFYANYGPAQFYLLAGLFKLFGPSVLVERLLDLSFKAGIVAACFAWTAVYCRKSSALLAAALCWTWLFTLIWYGSPLMPATLLSLAGSGLFLSAWVNGRSSRRLLAAGAVTGLIVLFRYYVGFGVLLAHLCFIVINDFHGDGRSRLRLRNTALSAGQYLAGTAIVCTPPALIYLAVAPLHNFVFDIITYPREYYGHARRLPFPGIPHSIDLLAVSNLVVYIPILAVGILLFFFFSERDRPRPDAASAPASSIRHEHLDQFFLLFGLLILVFYGKGLVRVDPFQMFLSIAPSLIVLVVLSERLRPRNVLFRYAVAATLLLTLLTTAAAGLGTAIKIFSRYHSSVLAELVSPPGPASLRNLTSWCGVPNPLHTGLCFLVDPDHIKAIQFIDTHTSPGDQLFVGLPHHDRIWANDILTYFATQRMPATRWYHFDPDLQTRADIQREMIHEIESEPVPYILLDSQWENIREPNDSSESSGVTLLDDFIRDNYQQVQSFGEMTVWQRESP